MIYFRYFLYVILDLIALLSSFIAVPILSLFTKAEPDLNEKGEPWGWIYGTWDNPPQGDSKWQREGWFPQVTTGWKGYLNRIGWLYRNPCYGYQRWAGVPYSKNNTLEFVGNEFISDKYAVPGSYKAKVVSPDGKVLAFEYYLIWPWNDTKCFRMRLGWKVMTDKYSRYGFATLVDTVTPYKGYGDA